MTADIVYLDVEMLQNFMFDVFVALGVPKEDAKICSDVLIASDLRGITSHGVQRLKMYYETGINKVEILIDKEKDRYAVACSNTRSFIQASSEQEALLKYVEAKAQSSKINTGDMS